ncbi:MAG: sigma-70 family RNA polymerase sigma factor [Saprospiraceae bacterium]|nr:sigma-70 family RNA polymerase sigma factor [Candidatus Brachybacter algidus]MBK8746512.1 sigma-70 family RNA polymerase sigma factor [Candidatus Brachybacter algidus]MBP7307390.1 sigma-70 family RNA polymerase sigma factor [Saprospiraceae bacterium]MBP9135245.1 sigma-70 family RNA polymerase sigma factor [Saprospiraceae bacterium]HQW13140.1 sigma-70 family RNA polymerase sigma factor [Saprospiraceae bacterium]
MKHDRNSQKLLYDRFSGQMYSICLRYCRDEFDAQESLQNGFIKVFKNLQAFKGESALYSWIKTIIIRSALDQIKKKKKDDELFVRDEIVSDQVGGEDPESMTYEEMLKIVQMMPLGYKTIFNMAVIDDMSHLEISNVLGITESTSRSQLMKARNYLKKQMLTKQNQYL